MTFSRKHGATLCLTALLSSCGTGHVSSKYEAYRSLNDTCVEDAAQEMALQAWRSDGAALAFAEQGGDVQLQPLRVGARSVEFEILIRGIPHCTRTIVSLAHSGLMSSLPSLPPVDDKRGWIEVGDTIHLLSSAHDRTFSATAQSTACLFETAGKLVPAWKLEGNWGGKPVRLFANGEQIFRQEAMQFLATGTATIYAAHPGSPLVPFALPELDGSGFLRSRRFQTDVPAEIQRAHALGPDFAFQYDPSDPRFREVSAFANAERMATFLAQEKFGYQMDCLPIHIRVPDRVQDEAGLWHPINNAAYIPPSFNPDGPFPLILLGEGDGIGLKDIPLDADVVFHELGHHVIFRTLKSTAYESRVIHEALADYLLFAKTDNACVGEGICPEGSSDCWRAGCLRSGDNILKLTDADLPTGYHQRSQVFSGMLWDLRKAIGRDAVDSVVFKSIDYLLWESRYEDLVFALLAADREVFGGAHACQMYDFAKARGLTERIAGLSCKDFADVTEEQVDELE